MNNTDFNSNNNQWNPQEPYDWKPWIWIGLAWVFVWPVGLILTIDKLKKDKHWRETSQRIQMFWETGEYGDTQPHYQRSWEEAQRQKQQARQQSGSNARAWDSSGRQGTANSGSASYNAQYEYHYSRDGQQSTAMSTSARQHDREARSAGRNRSNGSTTSPQFTAQRQKAMSQSKLQKIRARLTSPRGGRGLMIGGGITAAVFLFSLIASEIPVLLYSSLEAALIVAYPLLAFTLVGVALMVWGRKKIKRSRKFRDYFAKIGSRHTVSIQELSQLTGDSFHKTVDDLQYLLDKGAFGSNAYLDLSRARLVLDPDASARADEAQKRRAAQAAASKPEKEDDPTVEILKEIRRINDQIPDEHLSAQIDRIEEITRLILQCQKEHPEKAPQLHSFLSYYLPTTLKILNSYAELEKQSVQGKNITGTKDRIEGMMDKVVMGFENQLDQLFASDYMDISSDITVLEQMLKKDGLTSDFQTEIKTGSKTGSQGGSAVQYK